MFQFLRDQARLWIEGGHFEHLLENAVCYARTAFGFGLQLNELPVLDGTQ